MGFIRMSDYKIKPQRSLNRVASKLIEGPVVMNMKINYDFHEYGGGIHTARGCGTDKCTHSMVLVGHGREDNDEYWLFRNSYSSRWGEQGHYKLSKKAECSKWSLFYTLEADKTATIVENQHYAGIEPLKERMLEYKKRKAERKKSKQLLNSNRISLETQPEP